MNDSIYTRVYLEDFGAGNRTVVAFYDAVNDTIFKQKIFDLKKVDLRGTADKTLDNGLILTERYATVYQFPPPANPWILSLIHI